MAFYLSLVVTHLQILMGFSVIIEEADLTFWFDNLSTGTVFAQGGAF